MSALIELTAQGVAPEAEARGTRLRCESKPNLEIEGEHSRLAQVLLAVFCHALRAADTSEPITGRVHEAEGWATLKLAFTRRSNADDRAEEVFDWMCAGDVGLLSERLALSLARANAALHGGSLCHSTSSGAGAALVLRFPLVPTNRTA